MLYLATFNEPACGQLEIVATMAFSVCAQCTCPKMLVQAVTSCMSIQHKCYPVLCKTMIFSSKVDVTAADSKSYIGICLSRLYFLLGRILKLLGKNVHHDGARSNTVAQRLRSQQQNQSRALISAFRGQNFLLHGRISKFTTQV